ncbi:MAG TPA: hypothetical protein VIJ51_03805 [Solirubrobacteraceae bacterium]
MRRVGLLLGFASLTAIAGCGGGSKASNSSSGAAATTTTKAAFIAKADALCKKGKSVEPTEAQIVSLLTEVPLPRAHVAAVLHGAAAEVAKIDADIATLPRPAGDGAAIGKWLSEASNVASLVGQLGDAVASADDAGTGSTETKIIEATGDPINFAQTYGLTSCDSF